MFRNTVTLWIVIISLGFAGALLSSKALLAQSINNPAIKAVYFHADWCSNCRILQPRLAEAKTSSAGLSVQHVTLDFTNSQTWDSAIELALEHDIVSTYNAYAGTTGLVVLVASDTGERIDCVNRLYTPDAMVQAFSRAIERTQTTKPGGRDSNSVVCPPSRMRPPTIQ